MHPVCPMHRSLLAAGLLAAASANQAGAQSLVRTGLSPVGSSRDSIAGIAYRIDSLGDAGPTPNILKTFSGIVRFARGRGRLDIVAKSTSEPIRVEGLVIRAPLASVGDYYLFDSTGFVLVRPSEKTFASFWFADASYNYEGRRDGWPVPFEFGPLRPDAPGLELVIPELLLQHGSYAIYWHLDAPQGHEIARGRLTIVDAPAGEASVARWFAPTQALGSMTGAMAPIIGQPLTVTALSLWKAPRPNQAPTNVMGVVPLHDLRSATIQRSQLMLPIGYSETWWPGYEHASRLLPLSSDGGAKWRAFPLTER